MVIADTGFWIALMHRGDRNHGAAVGAFSNVNEPLITTTAVMVETCYLLQREFGARGAVRFVNEVDQGLAELFEICADDLSRISSLMKRYSSLPMDFADASLVLLAEKLGHGRILSTDKRDFGTYRWKNTRPFENLLCLA